MKNARLTQGHTGHSQVLMNAHVIEWMWWEFKKDNAWYWFPLKDPQPIIRFEDVT